MIDYSADYAGTRPLSNGLIALLDWNGNTIDVVTLAQLAAIEEEGW